VQTTTAAVEKHSQNKLGDASFVGDGFTSRRLAAAIEGLAMAYPRRGNPLFEPCALLV
jgi:hypothetical protein